MNIIYKKGNLLDCKEDYILHGCNAQGVMGSGVAKAIREKYPMAYDTYLCGHMQLGIVTFASQYDGKVIFNAITQEFYGRKSGVCYIDYPALRDALQRINHWFSQNDPNACLAMPMIGAGLGGGDWNTILEIIEQESIYFQPVVYKL